MDIVLEMKIVCIRWKDYKNESHAYSDETDKYPRL